jgi:hypothetical protein
MMTMNVANLTRAELAHAVSQRCAEFGDVTEITILQPTDKSDVAFALVGMKSTREIDRLVNELGAARVESLAVIRLEQTHTGMSAGVEVETALRPAPVALA